jgi:hypothetical protein
MKQLREKWVLKLARLGRRKQIFWQRSTVEIALGNQPIVRLNMGRIS